MTNYFTHTLLFLLLCGTIVSGQTTVPFITAGKLIVVQATVNGRPGNFILDTGVADLVLNARYFTGEATDKVFHGINGQAGDLAVASANLQIGDRKWNAVYAEVIPLDMVERAKHMPIHGLLGTNLFHDYTLVIDFQQLRVQLYPLAKNREDECFAREGIPLQRLLFQYKGRTPLVRLPFGSLSLRLTLDTGAEINLLSGELLELLTPYVSVRRRQRFCGFGGQTQEATLVHFTGLQIGPLISQRMNTAFVNLHAYNRHVAGPKADGIAGIELMRQFRVGFNFKDREIYLWEPRLQLLAENKESPR